MSATAAQTLRDAQLRLNDPLGPEVAARDARLLLAHAAGWSGAQMLANLHDPMPSEARQRFDDSIAARLSGFSVAHIIGEVEFYGRPFHVGKGDLAPRPDTETLVDLALAGPFETLLDLGTGTGVIAVTLLAGRAGVRGMATDLEDGFLDRARRNAARHGVADRLALCASDWFTDVSGRFDLITSNPPYVTEADYQGLAPDILIGERREALTPGGDGLAAYRVIAGQALAHLTSTGRLMVEIGHDQGQAVAEIFSAIGLAEVEIHGDINGTDRVVSGRNPA